MEQNPDAPEQTHSAATADALSQGTFLIDREEIKEAYINTHNAFAPTPFPIEQPAPPFDPEHPETKNSEDLPDWVEPPQDPQTLPW